MFCLRNLVFVHKTTSNLIFKATQGTNYREFIKFEQSHLKECVGSTVQLTDKNVLLNLNTNASIDVVLNESLRYDVCVEYVKYSKKNKTGVYKITEISLCDECDESEEEDVLLDQSEINEMIEEQMDELNTKLRITEEHMVKIREKVNTHSRTLDTLSWLTELNNNFFVYSEKIIFNII